MKNLHAIFWMVITTILFAIVTGMVRHLGTDLPAPVAAFVRYVASTIFFLPLIFKMFVTQADREKNKIHFARGICHGLGVIGWFFAMATIPVSEVTVIGYMTPVFVTIAAFFFLGERLSKKLILALAVGFTGMFVIVNPSGTGIEIGQLTMIIATIFFAGSYILAKQLSSSNSIIEVLTGLNSIVTLVLAPFAIFFWQTPSLYETLWLSLVAFFATCGHYTMTLAFKLAPISVTQPANYLQLVWATLIGFIFFGELIDIWFVLGSTLIILSTAYILIFAKQITGKAN